MKERKDLETKFQCDYKKCEKKPFAEIYPVDDEKYKKGIIQTTGVWHYVCLWHFIYLKFIKRKKLGWCRAAEDDL